MLLRLRYISAKGVSVYLKYLTYFYYILTSTRGPLYSIKLSNTKVLHLKDNGLDGGLEDFKNSLRPIIHLPPAIGDRPHIEYIRLANQIRKWN